MTRPEARGAAVPHVTAKTRRNGFVMQMVQEEAMYSDAARDEVGRNVHSDLCCLSAEARLDEGSKGRTLAWALAPAVIAAVELKVLATRLEAESADL
jgi:hypothetical protein